MMLVDFFTDTEMEHGLTNASQIEELVSAMQEENRNIDDVSEASRQWLTVASAISATNNKECLDLFITRDGPSVIAKWLKQAMNSDSMTELVTSLLKVLEKLYTDGERHISSDVSEAVQDVFQHGCLAVQETARTLYESWNLGEDGGDECAVKSSEDGDDAQADDTDRAHVSEEQGEGSEVSKRMEYGMVDALEVACLVAKEVEREVEDFAEPYCSSSSNKHSNLDPRNSESKGDDQSHVVDSSLITEANAERVVCDFDLNEEIHVEGDCPSINPTKPEPLDIDLNVAELDPTFGESAIDLNRVTDDFNSDALPQARMLSPASSSSSVPLPRNIDLNGPSLNNESSDHGSNLGEFSFGSYADKPTERVIFIMGKKVVIGGSGGRGGAGSSLPRPSPPCNSILPDGLGFGVPPATHYPHSPVYYGLNGISPGGTFPYMVDSRGIPVVPQLLPFSKTYPYPMSTFGVGPSHFQNFDLNSSDDGNREPPFLRQLLVNGDARAAMDDHMMINAQASLGLGICEKRKEPEGGWDPYPFAAVKRQMPPWR